VLQSVAVCCSLLQSVAVCCSLLQFVAVCCSDTIGRLLLVCCSVLQCVAVYCSLLQSAAVILQDTYYSLPLHMSMTCLPPLPPYTHKCNTQRYIFAFSLLFFRYIIFFLHHSSHAHVCVLFFSHVFLMPCFFCCFQRSSHARISERRKA